MPNEKNTVVELWKIERRNWQLWWIAVFVILALTVTIIGTQSPQLIGAPKDVSLQLKTYLFGLSFLVFLFCVYALQTVYTLGKLKEKLLTTEQEKMQIQSLLETVKERTERLQASEVNYRTLLERNLDAIVVVSRDTIVKFINPAAESLLGHEAEKLLGRPFGFPLAAGERSEITITRPDGGTVVAEMRVIGATWEGEKVRLASLRDITIRKHAEDALKKANEEFKKLDQMKSDFVSMVSHELRTPLTSIKNAVHLLSSGKAGGINKQQERFLLMAIRNIDRLAEIVNDLLDLSKTEAGKMQFHFSEMDAHSLINHVMATFQPQAEASLLKLEMDCPEGLPTVYADQARIEQVLCNLLSNAIKYTPSGGRVTLSARDVGENIEVSVADTGTGITPKEQERIFDRFYQVGDSLTRVSKGTGLGLAITRELVEAHGGRILLESEVDQGSRFFFTVPIFLPRTLEVPGN